MKVMNKIIKGLGYAVIYTVAFLQHYIIGIFCMGAVFSVLFGLWSFFAPLPHFVTDNYGKLLLIGSLPSGILFFIFSLQSMFKPRRKSKEQSSEEVPQK